MPILDIDVVTRPEERLPEALAADLADALGEVYGADPGRVWVRLHDLPPGRYAENAARGEAVFPVFVTVREGTPPEGSVLEARVARLAECVARLTYRPVEHVHVIVEPAMKGRIAFGGKLVT
jgi:phenylpyruvate tautomerase PptA (4-oxalocrotonate tautomerase family)